MLTSNQREQWRRVFKRGHANAFVQACRAAGATHAIFVANGNTVPAESGAGSVPTGSGGGGSSVGAASDLSRSLTNRGSAQCMVARDEWYGRLPMRPTLLTSPALRAKQTASHFAGQVEMATDDASLGAAVRVITRLHPSTEPRFAKVDELVRQKGNAPLISLQDSEGGETAFGGYAEAVCEQMASEFRASKVTGEKATYVGVFGQPVTLNAVAYAVATAAGCSVEALDAVARIDLGEAEGILVPLYGMGKEPIHLARPP